MVIVHIANITNQQFNGINVVVPEYIKQQKQYAQVHLVNLNSALLEYLSSDDYTNFKILANISDLKEPFNNPDLIIIHGIYDIKILLFYLRNIKDKYSYITIPHGGLTLLSQNKSKVKKIIANRLFYNSYFYNSVAVQFLSDHEKQNSIKCYRKSIVSGNGIFVNNTIQYKVKTRENMKLVYIGRLEMHHKGLDLMLEAINQIKEFLLRNNINIFLYGINYGNTYTRLSDFIEKNQLNSIVSVNDKGLFNTDKMEVLLDCDYFIQTSRYEGLSLGILEVLSLGIPVIVTEGVGMNEYLKKYKCGLLCKNNSKNIAENIIKAYEYKKENSLVNLSNNAFETAKLFEWSEVTKKTIRLYEEVINASKVE